MLVRRLAVLVPALLLLFMAAPDASAQRSAKYGADFLAGGVGARALGMGGAYVAVAGDVTAGYWNSAGLGAMLYPEVAYMHEERFSGVVSFDYGGVAFPITSRSTLGLSLIRLGVDDIPNTLNAWDRERNQPRPEYENYITRFSYAHYAFFLSYARAVRENLNIGVTGKVIRGSIGDFADSWGYSFDVGAQLRLGRVLLGANIQDASRMLQTWSVNDAAFADAEVSYEDFRIPEGGTEYVLPVARFGSGYLVPFGASTLTLGLDVDLAFDGQEAYAYNMGSLSMHPRLGGEFNYKGVVALRAGVSEMRPMPDGGFNAKPSVGAGLNLKQISLDYGFGDFAGVSSDLDYSHRISLQLRLEQPGLQRSTER